MDSFDTKIVLFTGAGASAPLKIPIMSEIIEFLKEKAREENVEDLLLFVVSSLSQLKSFNSGKNTWDKINDENDLEEIFLFLKKLETTEFLFDNLPTLSTGFSLDINDITGFRDLLSKRELLLSICKKIIFEQFGELNPEKKAIATKLYKPLLSLLLKVNNNFLPIFTTNYDSSLYDVCKKLNYSIFDGFSRGYNEQHSTWDYMHFPNIIPQNGNINVLLFQLHGAYNWVRNEATNEITYNPNAKWDNNDLNVIIYPEKDKFPTKDPFFTYYDCFRKYLEKAHFLIVIGYSFRDFGITSQIRSALRTNNQLRIIIVDPNIDEKRYESIKSDLGLVNKYRSQVIIGKFEIRKSGSGENYLTKITRDLNQYQKEKPFKDGIIHVNNKRKKPIGKKKSDYLAIGVTKNVIYESGELTIYPSEPGAKSGGIAIYQMPIGKNNSVSFQYKLVDSHAYAGAVQYGLVWLAKGNIFGLYINHNDGKLLGLYPITQTTDGFVYSERISVERISDKKNTMGDQFRIDFKNETIAFYASNEMICKWPSTIHGDIDQIGFCVYGNPITFYNIKISGL